jgi:hypothetical protein
LSAAAHCAERAWVRQERRRQRDSDEKAGDGEASPGEGASQVVPPVVERQLSRAILPERMSAASSQSNPDAWCTGSQANPKRKPKSQYREQQHRACMSGEPGVGLDAMVSLNAAVLHNCAHAD